jgi:Fe-S cluster assembly protein SufD
MQDIIINENEERVLPILWLGEEKELSYDVHLAGNGASVKFLMLLLGREMDRLDIRANIYHEKPNTHSKVIMRGALTDSAFANFDGLIKIEPGAKGTNAWLAAHILLLSNKAKGRAVPNLEIQENDIKAGHATTVGRVNDLELFYIMSRGISEQTAKSLIVQGFLDGMLKEFPSSLSAKVTKELSTYYHAI